MKPIYKPKGAAGEYAEYACNLYNGCTHGCTYCYAPAILRKDRKEFNRKSELRPGVLEALEKQLKTGQYKGKRILLSFTSDPYQLAHYMDNGTRSAIELIKKYGANFSILTKGGFKADEDSDLYDDGDRYGASLTFINECDSRKWESRGEEPLCRISYLESMSAVGITTWASLEPVIDPLQSLALIHASHHCVEEFKIGKANRIKGVNVDWHRFANEAVELCEKLGAKYYIKNDLRRFL